MFCCLRTHQTVSPKWLCHFIPTICEVLIAPCSYQHLILSGFVLAFILAISGGLSVKHYLIMVLVCFFLKSNNFGDLFMCFLAIYSPHPRSFFFCRVSFFKY